MPAIDVRQIVKKFGDFTAVDGVSFAVEEGEIFGLLGPNGAGKSTLIRMLTTLLPPTAGTALVSGFDVVAQADEVRRSIGVIPQAMTSDLELSVEENLLIFAKLYGVPRATRERLIHELLEAVELAQWRDKPVKNLSGGMRRRVEIARGLVHEPQIFFLDEPTTGLDPVSRAAVWEMLRRIKAERQPDGAAHDPLHGRGRQALRPHRDRRPRRAEGARLAVQAQGVHSRAQRGRGQLRERSRRLDRAAAGAAQRRGGERARRRLPHRHRRRSGHDARADAGGDARGRAVQSLAVQSTTLDDVFVHYAGRDLRDELQAPSVQDSPFMLRRG